MPDPEDIKEEPDADEGINAEEATSLNPTVDAGTKRGVRKQVLTAKRKAKDAEDFYKQVFATEVGRREMWDILMALHTFETRFAAGPTGFPDPLATWFSAGEQSAGQRLWKSWLKLDKDGVLLMMAEHDADLRKPA